MDAEDFLELPLDRWDVLRLKVKIKNLCDIEARISLEVSEARAQDMKPTEKVLCWLQKVETFPKEVDFTEIEIMVGNAIRFRRQEETIDRLLQQSNFVDAVVVTDEAQFPLPTSTMVGSSVQESLRKIWASLMDPRIGITGVYGLGGVGKTTTMMNIKNMLVTSNMFDKVLWITVSKEFSERKIRKEIASQLNLKSDLHLVEKLLESDLHLVAKLLERLKKIKKSVIIFDDIWKPFSLETVGVPQPSRESGCKIVLISRSAEVCDEMESDRLIGVEVLHPDEAWDLFVSKAGNIVYTPDILPLAKHVVTKCCGFPIVIVSVGLALQDEFSLMAWKKALEELNTLVAKTYKIDIVVELLRFCYNRLRTDVMKNCFLYCAFFHEDCLFKPDELIRYWMAEGFVHKDGDMVAEIDDGFKIMRTLLDANMLEMFTKNGDEWVKMHDLFRDMSIRIMWKDGTGIWVRTGHGLWISSFSKEWAKARKISLVSNCLERLGNIPSTFPNLSTLLLRDNPISHIMPLFFTKMRALSFLDISYSRIMELPPSLSELVGLQVLFLHFCTNLKKMPSLEKMKNLQVLNLCKTSITELPHGTEGLTSLRSLDLSETTNLLEVRAGVIPSLICLEELRMQGCGLCKTDSPAMANFLLEMRCLNRLSILTISSANYVDLLDTIVYLQEQSLKTFSINVYGSTDDYSEDAKIM